MCRRLLYRIMCEDSQSGLELVCHCVTPLAGVNAEEAVCGTGWPQRSLGVFNDTTQRGIFGFESNIGLSGS